MLLALKKKELIAIYGKNEKDTGLSEVQISLLTFQINYLQKHFISHKKDHCSRRGLLKMVSKRRKLLDYLKINSLSRYQKLIKNLNLRR
ncbi:30S ribosomal protein S15 [Buchnera aphidicola (Eriosoma grossulariae)]|uniref:30S ribosomal protein S15 n=1 Tax=Buchnera aphidicola TaxID=9 RepID=UPI003464B097